MPFDFIRKYLMDNYSTEGGPSNPGAAWPVGSVFISVVAENPNILLGFGTWQAFGAGRVLVGLDANDTDFNTIEKTGGAKAVQASAQAFSGSALAAHQHAGISAGTPAGTVSQPTFSGSALATHQHAAIGAGTPAGSVAWPGGVPVFTGSGSQATSAANTGATGSGSTSNTLTLKAHTHTLTPAGAVAWPAAVPTFSGSVLATHQHAAITAGTPAGTVSQPTFSGNALGLHQHDGISAGTPAGTNAPGAATSVVQPYITVYLWKRTA